MNVRDEIGEEPESHAALFDGDTGDASPAARMVITFLVRNRVLLGRDDPEMWDALVEHETDVVRHFHNMYVDLVIHRGMRVAFKQQVLPEKVPYSVTVRAVTLSLEASVLALYARERMMHAVPGETVVISRDEGRSQMEPYWPEHVANKVAKDKKLNAAFDALVGQDLLQELGADRWEVSPAIALVLSGPAVDRFTELLTAPEETPAEEASDHRAGPSELLEDPDAGVLEDEEEEPLWD